MKIVITVTIILILQLIFLGYFEVELIDSTNKSQAVMALSYLKSSITVPTAVLLLGGCLFAWFHLASSREMVPASLSMLSFVMVHKHDSFICGCIRPCNIVASAVA